MPASKTGTKSTAENEKYLAKIDEMRTKTRSEIDTYISANVTNTAEIITYLKKLTKIVVHHRHDLD